MSSDAMCEFSFKEEGALVTWKVEGGAFESWKVVGDLADVDEIVTVGNCGGIGLCWEEDVFWFAMDDSSTRSLKEELKGIGGGGRYVVW